MPECRCRVGEHLLAGPLEGGHPLADVGTDSRRHRSGARRCVVVVRDQAYPDHRFTEEACRVDVLVAQPHAEVERSTGHGDRRPGPEPVALGHEYGPHEAVGRAESAAVVDRDEQLEDGGIGGWPERDPGRCSGRHHGGDARDDDDGNWETTHGNPPRKGMNTRGKSGRIVDWRTKPGAQTGSRSAAAIRERSWRTALVWI